MNQAVLEEVRFERVLPGPVERVWEYLTKPELQRIWLAESASEFDAVTTCQPNRSIEFALRDSSTVSMELKALGAKVRLVLTHRRKVPGWLTGAGTVIAVALLAFSFFGPASPGASQARPSLGLQARQSAPTLKFHSSRTQPLYGMLGGRC